MLRKDHIRLVVVHETVETVSDYTQSIGDPEFLIENEPGSSVHVENKNTRQKMNKTVTNIKKNQCCERLEISSMGITAEWYPNLLGVYTLQTEVDRQVYKMMEGEKYLSRPRKEERSYRWGVNPKPGLTWGWLKALYSEECPERVRHWAAFNKNNKGRFF